MVALPRVLVDLAVVQLHVFGEHAFRLDESAADVAAPWCGIRVVRVSNVVLQKHQLLSKFNNIDELYLDRKKSNVERVLVHEAAVALITLERFDEGFAAVLSKVLLQLSDRRKHLGTLATLDLAIAGVNRLQAHRTFINVSCRHR